MESDDVAAVSVRRTGDKETRNKNMRMDDLNDAEPNSNKYFSVTYALT